MRGGEVHGPSEKDGRMTKRDEFTKQIAGLADRVEQWTVPHGWVTQHYPKK